MHLVGFLAASIVLIVLPGPDFALVGRNALRAGRRGGIASAFGVVAGLLVWSLAASLGVAALLRASAPAFWALKLVGAAYLLWIGLHSLRDALRRRAVHAESRAEGAVSARVCFRQGILCDLGNPKAAVIFTTFLPQFVPAHEAGFMPIETLGLLFCSLALAWYVVYALAVARAGDLLRSGPLRRAIDALSGLVLVAFGAKLGFERR